MSNQQDKKQKNPNVPNLRFSNKQWRHQKIGFLCSVQGGGTPSTKNQSYWRGTIPWVSSADLNDDIHSLNITRFITMEAIANSATKINKKGSVLLVTRVGVGKVAIAPQDICTSQDFTNLYTETLDTHFLAYSLKRLMKQVSSQVQGTSIKGITSSKIKELEIAFPSLGEQLQIVKVLCALDKRIEVQNKIIEELGTATIQLCRAMKVSQDCRLGDLCSCKMNQIKESDLHPVGQYPVYGAAGLAGYLNTFEFSKPGIAIIKDGAGVGRSYEIKSKNYSVLGTMALLLPNNEVPASFLWAAMQGIDFKSFVVGSGIPHIYFKNYGHAEIADLSTDNLMLSRLVSLLKDKRNNAEEVLACLKSQKAFFLANMFI